MSTRCLTSMHDEDGKEIAVLYRHSDGYPEGHGKELSQFLTGKRIQNGIGQGDTSDNMFNGMHCLAAALVAHFKDDTGGYYLHAAGTRDIGEEYIYWVTGKPGDSQATVSVTDDKNEEVK